MLFLCDQPIFISKDFELLPNIKSGSSYIVTICMFLLGTPLILFLAPLVSCLSSAILEHIHLNCLTICICVRTLSYVFLHVPIHCRTCLMHQKSCPQGFFYLICPLHVGIQLTCLMNAASIRIDSMYICHHDYCPFLLAKAMSVGLFLCF